MKKIKIIYIYIYIYIYTIGNESLQIVSKLILILVWKFIWLYKRCLSIWFYELMGHNKNIMSKGICDFTYKIGEKSFWRYTLIFFLLSLFPLFSFLLYGCSSVKHKNSTWSRVDLKNFLVSVKVAIQFVRTVSLTIRSCAWFDLKVANHRDTLLLAC